MALPRALFVRVLVFQEEGQWLAQGLEYDMTSQAPSPHQAVESFIRLFTLRIKRDLELGRMPLADVPEAPEWIQEQWAQLREHEELIPVSVLDAPPAYVIHALAEQAGDAGVNR